MNKEAAIDFLGCIGFKILGPLIRILPKESALFLGKKMGELIYYVGYKHRSIAYANIKTALGEQLSPRQISGITKAFYQAYGQNIIEIFLIPLVNREYIKKYIQIEGIDHVYHGLKRGKGIILLGVHEGSWELSNVICGNLGFDFTLFIRDQGYPRLNRLLNYYRRRMGCRVIERRNGIRQLINSLKNNQAIGMTADQGGKNGILVKFFNKTASMPYGAIRLALKYDATLIPAFYLRTKGPYIKTIIAPALKLKKSGNLKKDIRDNLEQTINIFERFIEKYPKEYLWSYKIWKYSDQRRLLILSDGKTGHLRQSQLVAKILQECLQERSIKLDVDTVEVKFKNKCSRIALLSGSLLSGRFCCQGCLVCFRNFLTSASYQVLIRKRYDFIVSSGASLAAINFILSRENNSKSIVNMRPPFLSTNRFDLVIVPRHDQPRERKNIVITEGALNIIDEEYLRQQVKDLSSKLGFGQSDLVGGIGFFVGGDNKNFRLSIDLLRRVINQIKSISESLGRNVFVTTSRRTAKVLEELVKNEFSKFAFCKILVIANENNIPSAVGGILGVSKVVVVSPESISMISEAVASQRYVLVFNAPGLGSRHKRFLDRFSKKQYISLCETENIAESVRNIFQTQPRHSILADKLLVRQAIGKLI